MNRVSCNQLAGRWAAKEAVVKALGTGWRGIRYADVEVRRDDRGAPNVQLHGTAAARASLWGNCQWQFEPQPRRRLLHRYGDRPLYPA